MRPTRPAAHGSSDVSALIEAEERRLQPWGYLYGLIWPSHTETIHSYLLLLSRWVPLLEREEPESDSSFASEMEMNLKALVPVAGLGALPC